jgi:glucose-6-phosphate dehydrogenase assembly protein OpcA
MNASADEPLLPSGVEVPFSQMGATLERLNASKGGAPARALTATAVVVGTRAKLREAADALERLTTNGGVRVILISPGTNPSPSVRIAEQAIALDGLRIEYLNNAVAALRLSSLPTVVWWRGQHPEVLGGLAVLADRLVLDGEDPVAVWPRASALTDDTAITDLRWTRLTRWRALMAHFFDIPAVRDAAPAFTRLEIAGSDRHTARLFAGWLSSSLRWNGRVSIDMREAAGGAPLESVTLGDGTQTLELHLAPSRTCVKAAATVTGHAGATRTVSLGDQSLAALIAEELRVRSRDLAFEQALAALEGVS